MICLIIFISFLLILSFIHFNNLPIVEMNWPDKECIQVISINNEYNCSNLPKKYEIIWIINEN